MDAQHRLILSEVSYYHQFHRPLTLLELAGDRSLSETEADCEQLIANGKLARTQGFYHLPGASDTVTVRLARYAISDAILRAASAQIRWISVMPGVEAVFLCNSLATLHGTADSDIDFLIITHSRRLFAARFWTVLFARLFGTRPRTHGHVQEFDTNTPRSRHKQTVQPINGLCLSFFLRRDALNLNHLRIEGEDIYLDHWIRELVPLYDPHGLYALLRVANHVTSPEVLPSEHRRPRLALRHRAVRAVLNVLTWLLPEALLEWVQWQIVPRSIKAIANRGTAVVWNERMLKFHDHDRRAFYRDGWKATLDALL